MTDNTLQLILHKAKDYKRLLSTIIYEQFGKSKRNE